MQQCHLPGRTRRQLAAELIGELEAVDRKLKDLTKRLRQAVTASGSGLEGCRWWVTPLSRADAGVA